MDDDKEYQERLNLLRKKALARLYEIQTAGDSPLSSEADRLLQDLHVHQIELELQNEELRQAQLELQRSRDRYLDLYHHAPVGYVVTDGAGIVIQANQTIARMLDCDMSELVRRPLAGIIHPDDKDIFYARFRAFYNNPDKKNLHVRIACNTGNIIYAKLEGRRVDETGDEAVLPGFSGHLLITISDVTRAKMDEQAIIRAKQQWEQTFDAVPDLIAIIDDQFDIVRVNKAMAKRLDLSPAECVGKKCFQILHSSNRRPDHCPHQQFLSSGLPSQVESYSQKLKGDFITSVSPLHLENRAESWCIHISHDVTDRKKAERELIKSRNLESLGTLAGGIAHDVNNLLTALIGNIDLAQSNWTDERKSSVLLDESIQSALRIRDLANRFITFAEGGAPRTQPVTIRRLIEDVTQISLKGSRVACHIQLPQDLNAMVVDEVQIKTALCNVLDNAREAMAGEGSLEISAGNVLSEDPRADPYIRLDFKDTGVGIAAGHLNKIFDPYFSTKQMGAQKGMGLGLAITHSIVKKHKGQISVWSEEGQGTTISVFLPADAGFRQIGRQIETFHIDNQQHGVPRLLVMESETGLWELITEIIHNMDFAVDCAAGSQAALDLFRQSLNNGSAYSAVLLGLITRDGIGGNEVLQKIRAMDPNVKAVVLSSHTDDPVFIYHKRYGFSGAIKKPFDLEAFRALITRIVGSAGSAAN